MQPPSIQLDACTVKMRNRATTPLSKAVSKLETLLLCEINSVTESASILEQIQSLQSLPNHEPQQQRQNLLSTEMGCEIRIARLSWRASTRRTVAKDV